MSFKCGFASAIFSIASFAPSNGSLMAGEPQLPSPEKYNVEWVGHSSGSIGSMPLGNGDIGLNVWVESSGDILFHLSKTDAWDGNGQLVKVARVRLRTEPALTSATVKQKLSLQDASIRIDGDCGGQPIQFKLWVDAMRPVVWIELNSTQPVSLHASVELWRNNEQSLVRFQKDRLLFLQSNGRAKVSIPKGAPDPISSRRFGGLLKGSGLVSDTAVSLKSAGQTTSATVLITLLSSQSKDDDEFIKSLEEMDLAAASVKRSDAWEAHSSWWRAFWSRSWIQVESKTSHAEAFSVSQGYALQRLMNACAGRGAFPIKFNGSIFTMDRIESDQKRDRPMDADWRRWGGSYWLQNTRLVYWPMLASGDFEMMRPFFRMYAGLTPYLAARSEAANKHAGAEFFETISIFGQDSTSNHTLHDWNGALELMAMLLDYYAYTGEKQAVDEWLAPMAKAYLDFFDLHFKRQDGKLLMTPSHANETYWDVVNPTPDVAGLQWVIDGLLKLPEGSLPSTLRGQCERMRQEIPPLPLTSSDWAAPFRSTEPPRYPFPVSGKAGAMCIAPAATINDKLPNNSENPELYAIFPFRIFGCGKPSCEVAVESFERRLAKANYCWHHDEIQAAYLGLATAARKGLCSRAKGMDSQCRFPAFWGPGHDYTPDMDHGGVLMEALQRMILQADNGKLLLLPAWPKDWNVDFKLHAPDGRIVQGKVEDGRLLKLNVEPSPREQDLIVHEPQ